MICRRHLTTVIVLVSLMGCGKKPAVWTTFTPPGDTASASVPGAMKEKKEASVEDGNSSTKVYAYEITKDDGYIVAVSSLKNNLKLNPIMRTAAMAAAIPQLSVQFNTRGLSVAQDRESDLTIPNGNAKEIVLKPKGAGRVWIRARVYITESHVRQFYVTGRESLVNGADAQKFFDSITLND